MSKHDKPTVNTATAVIEIGQVLSEVLCCQAYFVLVMDDHSGTMPAVENVLQRPRAERQRAADVLRMWAARIEAGKAPTKVKG